MPNIKVSGGQERQSSIDDDGDKYSDPPFLQELCGSQQLISSFIKAINIVRYNVREGVSVWDRVGVRFGYIYVVMRVGE